MEVEEISSTDPISLKKNSLIGQESVAQDIVEGLLDIIDINRSKNREETNEKPSTSAEDVPSTDAAMIEEAESSNGEAHEKSDEGSDDSSAPAENPPKTNGTSESKEASNSTEASSSDVLVNGSSTVISVSSDSSLDDSVVSKPEDSSSEKKLTTENVGSLDSKPEDKDVVEVALMEESSSSEKESATANAASLNDKGCSADDGSSGANCENDVSESADTFTAAQDESSSDSVFKGTDEDCVMEEGNATEKGSSVSASSRSISSSPPPLPPNGAVTSSRLASDLSATISQLAARVSRGDDSASASGLGREKSVEDRVADVSMEDDDDDDDDEEEDSISDARPSTSKEASVDISASNSRDDNRSSSPAAGSSLPGNDDAPTPITPSVSLTSTSPQLTKAQINAIIEQRFQAYVKNLCKTDELETRFSSLEEWTENLRKKHREQVFVRKSRCPG